MPAAEVAAAFGAAERLLGRDWIMSHRLEGGILRSGAAPTLTVAWVGQALLSVDGCRGLDTLVRRLVRRDRAAYAELQAAYLCVVGRTDLQLEFEPNTTDPEHNGRPDFRLRKPADEWTYVEVAAPDISAAQKSAQAIMQRLTALIGVIPAGTALDLALRRDPTDTEVDHISSEMQRLASEAISQVVEYEGLASIAINLSPPANFVLHDDGGPPLPRLGLARFQGPGDAPANKRLSVRYPFSDERAEAFLTHEARQLPRDAPGIVMFEITAGALGALKSWKPLLSRRLQPNLHTRVSAICLYEAGYESTPAGAACVAHTAYVANPHARKPAPSWLEEALRQFQSESAAS